MAWDNPHWAAFSVAFCSLATVGESLLKGMLRTFGTFAAIFVALFLLALFPQDRWIFTLCVSLWVAFCTWKMHANPNWYFWFCAGLGVPLMSMLSGGESLQAFQTVVLRAQETILGTLVFTVVSSLVFPTNTKGSFEQDIKQQLKDIHEGIAAARRALLTAHASKDALDLPPDILKQAALRQTGLMAKLEAAALDSFDIAETKRAWSKAVLATAGAVDALERLRLGLTDLESTNPSGELVELEHTLDEFLRRAQAARDIVEGKTELTQPLSVGLDIDAAAADSLPTFQRAALVQTVARLREIDHHSKDLLVAIADVYGIASDDRKFKKPATEVVWLPDPERIYGTLRVFTAFWLTFLAYIFVPDLPSAVVLIAMTTAVSMLMMMAPTLPLRGLARPVMVSILFGGAVHLLLMPKLSDFAALAVIIFVVTFLICWLCHTPRQAMGRALGLAFFAVLIQVENAQTYSFTFAANLTVAVGLVLGILVLVSYFPVSFQPERVFLRLAQRYFDALNALLETLHVEKREAGTWLERQRRAYYTRQLKIIPGSMAAWIRALPKDAVTDEERKTLLDIMAGLAVLGDRTRDLLSTRHVEHSDFWVNKVVSEARAWRHAIQNVCEKLGSVETASLETHYLEERLLARMAAIEEIVADALSAQGADSPTSAQSDAVFRELGGFRGVSVSLISLVKQIKQIDWARLREARL